MTKEDREQEITDAAVNTFQIHTAEIDSDTDVVWVVHGPDVCRVFSTENKAEEFQCELIAAFRAGRESR